MAGSVLPRDGLPHEWDEAAIYQKPEILELPGDCDCGGTAGEVLGRH